MTEQERTDYFKRKHDEVVERLCGPAKYPIPNEVEYGYIDEHWSDETAFYDRPRIHKNMNADIRGLAEYQKQLRENGGRVITHVDATLDAEVPPPIK